jgi:hypothetical protein
MGGATGVARAVEGISVAIGVGVTCGAFVGVASAPGTVGETDGAPGSELHALSSNGAIVSAKPNLRINARPSR